jgi:hypothetical protein
MYTLKVRHQQRRNFSDLRLSLSPVMRLQRLFRIIESALQTVLHLTRLLIEHLVYQERCEALMIAILARRGNLLHNILDDVLLSLVAVQTFE